MPDLTVSGYGGPVAAWGGPYTVNLAVSNLGSNSFNDVFALTDGLVNGTPSSATAPATQVAVYFSLPRRPNRRVLIGLVDVPSTAPNSVQTVSATFAQLPSRPPGFPTVGGDVELSFSVDSLGTNRDTDRTNNFRRASQPVRILPPLPDLAVVGLDLPPVMQPGDVVQPNIQIANNGTVVAGGATPIDVSLIASSDPNFRSDVRVIDSYTIQSLPGLSQVPMEQVVLGDAGIDLPANIIELTGDPVTLPNFSPDYYVTVVVDPDNQIPELRELGRGARRLGLDPHEQSSASPVRRVGPPIDGLTPAGIVSQPPSSATSNPFPFPSFPVSSTPGGIGGEILRARRNRS